LKHIAQLEDTAEEDAQATAEFDIEKIELTENI
jgi:hypothetical protein